MKMKLKFHLSMKTSMRKIINFKIRFRLKMESKLINPFSLLGVDVNSSMRDLKKNYYNMALLCHPDRGGDKKDMNVVCLAYNYIKEQFENIKDDTYEDLEEQFENFCKEQESKEIPKFGKIYEETNDWIVEFNKEFDKKTNIEDKSNINSYDINPFKNGYGDLMDKEENKKEEYTTDNIVEPTNIFIRDIIEYKEPEALPNDITFYPLDKKPTDIKDFSEYNKNVCMSDYKLAFYEPEKLNQVEERDYPTENIDYQ